MKLGARLAVGVGAGYLLGRTKKMRLALMIAAASATGRAGTSPQALLRNGLKQLGSSAELSKLTDLARDELLGAAKAAAVSAATNRIESLNDRLLEGGGKIGKKPSGESGGDEAEPQDDAEDERERAEDERESAEEEGESAEEEGDSAESPRRSARRSRGGGDDDAESQRPVRRRASSRRASSDGEEPARRSRSTSRRAPVRRAGR